MLNFIKEEERDILNYYYSGHLYLYLFNKLNLYMYFLYCDLTIQFDERKAYNARVEFGKDMTKGYFS